MLAVYIPGWGTGQVISRIYYNVSGQRSGVSVFIS